ncbi:MAG TPA: hypothetical protein VHA37_09820 [Candidatus Saccharimonadales bacterium]|nr:hypothetical protein [Candidatus Saccharimonadales bacterium]
MAVFEQTYQSEHAPEELWRAINTPLDPELASLVHEDLEVSYDRFDVPGQIGLGTTVTYVASETGREKVPLMYRALIPNDVAFYVTRMSTGYRPGEEALRHDVLISDKASGSITRTVEADGGGSILVVEAGLVIGAIGDMFDDKIVKALEHCVGEPSQNTIDLLPEILSA